MSKITMTLAVKDAMCICSYLKRDKSDLEEQVKSYIIDKNNLAYSYMEYEDKCKHLELMKSALKNFENCLDSTPQVQEISFLFGEMRKVKESGNIRKLFENVDKIYKEKISIYLNKEESEMLYFN